MFSIWHFWLQLLLFFQKMLTHTCCHFSGRDFLKISIYFDLLSFKRISSRFFFLNKWNGHESQTTQEIILIHYNGLHLEIDLLSLNILHVQVHNTSTLWNSYFISPLKMDSQLSWSLQHLSLFSKTTKRFKSSELLPNTAKICSSNVLWNCK